MRLLEIAAAVGLTAAASVGIVALGMYKSARAEPLPSAPSQLVRLQGVLREVDASAGVLKVGDPSKPMTLSVGDQTTVFTHGRIGTLRDLRVGDPVCVAYEADGVADGRVTAEWVEPCQE